MTGETEAPVPPPAEEAPASETQTEQVEVVEKPKTNKTVRGISLKHMQGLLEEFKELPVEADAESEGKRFVETFIKTQTEDEKSSYIMHLVAEYTKKAKEAHDSETRKAARAALHQDIDENLGAPTHYICHDGKSFEEVVVAVQAFERRNPSNEVYYYWLDFLALNYHEPPVDPEAENSASALRASKVTLVVVNPPDPGPLEIGECITQMALTLESGNLLEISGGKELHLFKEDAIAHVEGWLKFNVEDAKFSSPEARERCLTKLKECKDGMEGVNSSLKRVLENYTIMIRASVKAAKEAELKRLQAEEAERQRSPSPGRFSIDEMDEDKTVGWMRRIGAKKKWKEGETYANMFEEEGVSMSTLLIGDHDMLKQLGIKKLGHRIEILALVAKWNETPKQEGPKEKTGEAGGRADVSKMRLKLEPILRCYKCNTFGHTAQFCTPANQKERAGKANKTKCWNCGQYGHKAAMCTEKERICFACGQKGHNQFSEACTASKKTLPPKTLTTGSSGNRGNQWCRCWNCGDTRHITRNCPHPRGQEHGKGLCFVCWDVGHISNFCPNRCTYCKETKKTKGARQHNKYDCEFRKLHDDYDPALDAKKKEEMRKKQPVKPAKTKRATTKIPKLAGKMDPNSRSFLPRTEVRRSRTAPVRNTQRRSWSGTQRWTGNTRNHGWGGNSGNSGNFGTMRQNSFNNNYQQPNHYNFGGPPMSPDGYFEGGWENGPEPQFYDQGEMPNSEDEAVSRSNTLNTSYSDLPQELQAQQWKGGSSRNVEWNKWNSSSTLRFGSGSDPSIRDMNRSFSGGQEKGDDPNAPRVDTTLVPLTERSLTCPPRMGKSARLSPMSPSANPQLPSPANAEARKVKLTEKVKEVGESPLPGYVGMYSGGPDDGPFNAATLEQNGAEEDGPSRSRFPKVLTKAPKATKPPISQRFERPPAKSDSSISVPALAPKRGAGKPDGRKPIVRFNTAKEKGGVPGQQSRFNFGGKNGEGSDRPGRPLRNQTKGPNAGGMMM